MPIIRVLAILALLLAGAVAVSVPAPAQGQGPMQCSDGVDNDSDNAIDGADAGCGDGADNDETDSPYAGIQLETVPVPVFNVQGTVSRRGVVKIDRMLVRANRGFQVQIRCKGRHCPVKSLTRMMLTNKLRISRFERRLKPSMKLTVRVVSEGQLGKWVRYTIRHRKAPVRRDSCIDEVTGKVRKCFLN